MIDDFNREGLNIEIDHSLPSERVIRSLEQIISWRGAPQVLRCDNGPEYISMVMQKWAQSRGIRIEYIQPGNPQQNAYVERFNRTVRYEWLASTCSRISTKFRCSQLSGYGPTITNAQTWAWAELHQNNG